MWFKAADFLYFHIQYAFLTLTATKCGCDVLWNHRHHTTVLFRIDNYASLCSIFGSISPAFSAEMEPSSLLHVSHVGSSQKLSVILFNSFSFLIYIFSLCVLGLIGGSVHTDPDWRIVFIFGTDCDRLWQTVTDWLWQTETDCNRLRLWQTDCDRLRQTVTDCDRL